MAKPLKIIFWVAGSLLGLAFGLGLTILFLPETRDALPSKLLGISNWIAVHPSLPVTISGIGLIVLWLVIKWVREHHAPTAEQHVYHHYPHEGRVIRTGDQRVPMRPVDAAMIPQPARAVTRNENEPPDWNVWQLARYLVREHKRIESWTDVHQNWTNDLTEDVRQKSRNGVRVWAKRDRYRLAEPVDPSIFIEDTFHNLNFVFMYATPENGETEVAVTVSIVPKSHIANRRAQDMTVHFIEPTFYSDDARKMWPRREQKAAETMTIEKVEDWRDMLRTGKAVIEMDDLSFSTKQELTSWLRGRPAYLTLEPHLSGLMPDGAIDEQLAWISENLDRLAVGAVRF